MEDMKKSTGAGSYVVALKDLDKSKLPLAGGKGANLGELFRVDGINVPGGFCILTGAFKRIVEESPLINGLLEQLSLLKAEERDEINKLSAAARKALEEIIIPRDIHEEIIYFLSQYDERCPYAVRSSATAEDLPDASFAGQQDSYLNIVGKESILQHIGKCWASLYTDRAIIYRLKNGFDHKKIYLAVVVQEMVFPDAAGILFTADPVTSNRKITSIDAGFGLGEALVSGLVNPDNYKVRDGIIVGKKVAEKKRAILASAEGGTKKQEIELAKQGRQVLSDLQILQLEDAGRRIEKHFGFPQDIEWCLANDLPPHDTIYIVQSRPITTLYPVPDTNDQQKHVYISVGHQQMMTDAMKPLGLSVWQFTATTTMYTAGGRLFVDIMHHLESITSRTMIVDVLGKSDPLLRDALKTIVERDFIISGNDGDLEIVADKTNQRPLPDFKTLNAYDPSIVYELIGQHKASIEELKQVIETKSGQQLVDLIMEDRQRRNTVTDQKSFGVIMTAMNAATWVNEKIMEWLGEKNVADTLSQSVSNNITSEMGLELLEVADTIRPYQEVIDYLQQVKEETFLDDLDKIKGGRVAKDAIIHFLNKYGMRCAGEIDITRTRWSEKPVTLVPVILGNIKNLEPGAGKRKFEAGCQQAFEKEQELLIRLKQLPDGEGKADEIKRMIDLIRNLSGYREYPKYTIVCRYFIYKKALLKEAERLMQANTIRDKEDIYYLSLEELRELVRTGVADYRLINQRKEEFKRYEKLIPPRVMTSDGEIITGKYDRKNVPSGALTGLPVSSGVIEGRARIILHMEEADLEAGDILVTTFTDPSWTPLFVSIHGLVTEVGGLMTHGAVIAREYGLPAVVGVEDATQRIKDGQQIRVNGTDGYVEIIY
jgi:pyruvate,water dikinase